jgi:hypothetical protein
VGTGKLEASAMGELLTAGTPALDGASAPARGLCLRRVVLGRRGGPRPGNDKGNDDDNETGHEE